jgi:hypothetical protein
VVPTPATLAFLGLLLGRVVLRSTSTSPRRRGHYSRLPQHSRRRSGAAAVAMLMTSCFFVQRSGAFRLPEGRRRRAVVERAQAGGGRVSPELEPEEPKRRRRRRHGRHSVLVGSDMMDGVVSSDSS